MEDHQQQVAMKEVASATVSSMTQPRWSHLARTEREEQEVQEAGRQGTSRARKKDGLVRHEARLKIVWNLTTANMIFVGIEHRPSAIGMEHHTTLLDSRR